MLVFRSRLLQTVSRLCPKSIRRSKWKNWTKLRKIQNALELYCHAECCGQGDIVVAKAAIIHVEVRVVAAIASVEFETSFKENAQVFGKHVL